MTKVISTYSNRPMTYQSRPEHKSGRKHKECKSDTAEEGHAALRGLIASRVTMHDRDSHGARTLLVSHRPSINTCLESKAGTVVGNWLAGWEVEVTALDLTRLLLFRNRT